MWILGNIEDVRSDFSAVHRVHRMEDLDSDILFPLARRLVAYKGAVRFKAEEEAEKRDKEKNRHSEKKTKDSNQWFLERKAQLEKKREGAPAKKSTELDALGVFESG